MAARGRRRRGSSRNRVQSNSMVWVLLAVAAFVLVIVLYPKSQVADSSVPAKKVVKKTKKQTPVQPEPEIKPQLTEPAVVEEPSVIDEPAVEPEPEPVDDSSEEPPVPGMPDLEEPERTEDAPDDRPDDLPDVVVPADTETESEQQSAPSGEDVPIDMMTRTLIFTSSPVDNDSILERYIHAVKTEFATDEQVEITREQPDENKEVY